MKTNSMDQVHWLGEHPLETPAMSSSKTNEESTMTFLTFCDGRTFGLYVHGNLRCISPGVGLLCMNCWSRNLGIVISLMQLLFMSYCSFFQIEKV